jgi:hypothetical protein
MILRKILPVEARQTVQGLRRRRRRKAGRVVGDSCLAGRRPGCWLPAAPAWVGWLGGCCTAARLLLLLLKAKGVMPQPAGPTSTQLYKWL